MFMLLKQAGTESSFASASEEEIGSKKQGIRGRWQIKASGSENNQNNQALRNKEIIQAHNHPNMKKILFATILMTQPFAMQAQLGKNLLNKARYKVQQRADTK